MTIRIVASFFVKNLSAASDAAFELETRGYEVVTSHEHLDDYSSAVHMEAYIDVAGYEALALRESIDVVMAEVQLISVPLGGECWMVAEWEPHLHKPFHHHQQGITS